MPKLEEDIINSLNALMMSIELYPPKHPSLIRAGEKAVENLRSVLFEKGSSYIAIKEGLIAFNGIPIYSIQSAKVLGRILATIKIGGIEFKRGISSEEIIKFFSLLSTLKSSGDQAVKDIEKSLQTLNIKHISVYPEEVEDIKERAKKAYRDAKKTVIEIMNEARLGRISGGANAVRIIGEFNNILVKNKNILLGMVMIQHFDEYTFSHCVNVGIIAMAVGKTLNLSNEDVMKIGLGGFMHDIGKVHTPKNIILKPAPLTPEEWVIMQRHPIDGAQMVQEMEEIPKVVSLYVYQHHVGYDLSGYPKLKSGEKQLMEANLVQIADTYDSMTTQRPYQKRFDPKEAIDIMRRKVGKAFNEELFDAFVNTLGIYPIGSIVRLDTNEIAVVTRLNPGDPMRPVVQIIFDPLGRRLKEPVEVYLDEKTPGGGFKRSIVKTVDSLTQGLINISSFFE